jgi:hypothetical protein
MAQNSMSGDFIQNMLAMLQLRQQAQQFQQQHQLARQTQQAGLLQLLSGVTQNMPDRGAAWDFLQAQGEQSGLNLDALLALARGQAPTETAIRADAANAGRAAMAPVQLANQNAEAASVVGTGMNQSQSGLSSFLNTHLNRMTSTREVGNMLGETGILKFLTGMTPGQFSMDQAVHNLQPEEITAAARMSQGLQLTAPQAASNALTARGQDLGYSSSMASNRLGWASLAQQGELGYLDLQMRQQLATMQGGGKGGLQINDIPEIVRVQQSLTQDLQKATTPAARQALLNYLGTVNTLLNSMGVPTQQINPVEDVNQFTPFNILHPWQTWQPGQFPGGVPGRVPLPMYNPQLQAGATQFGGGAR